MIGPRLKDLGRWYSGGTPPSEERDLWDGQVPWLSGKDFDKTRLRAPTKFVTEEGAVRHSRLMPAGTSVLVLVRGMALAHGLPVARLSFDAAINQDVRGLVVAPTFDASFVYYALLGLRRELNVHIDRAAHGTARLRDTAYAYRLRWMPDVDGQRALAEFLDRECERVSAAASVSCRLRDALTLARADVSTRLFADSAGASVPLWAATDPARPIMYGIVLPGEHVPGGVPVVKGGDVENDRLRPELLSRTTPAIDAAYARSRLHEGDVLVTIRGSYGASKIVPAALAGANITQDAARVSPAPGIDGRWLRLLMLSAQVREQLDVVATGATIRGVNIRDLKRIRVPLPERADQEEATISATAELHELSGAMERVVDANDGLVAYRDALIHEAVTGKIDPTRVSEQQMEERLHAATEDRLPEVPA